MCFRDRIKETRPGVFVVFNVIHFNGTKLKLTAFIKPDGIHIHSHRLGINSFFIQKLTTFFTPFLFIKYSNPTHRKHHIYMLSFRM